MPRRPSTTRVASRYLSAIVVSPRRQREYAMYRGFLNRFKRDLAAVEATRDLVEKAEEPLWAGGFVNSALPYFDKEIRILDRLGGELGDRVDLPYHERNKDYYQDLYWTGEAFKRELGNLQDEMRGWQSRWAVPFAEAVASPDFDDEAVYSDDLTDAEVRQLKALPALVQKLPDAIDLML